MGTGGSGSSAAPREGAPVVIRSAMSEGMAAGTASAPTPVSLPPSPPTDFEQFVQDSLGHSLPVFGRSLFTSATTGFVAPPNIAPPADYVLGTGDEVIIRAWGKIDIDAHATVDTSGQIFVPRLGTLTVAGMRVDQLTEFIRRSISQQFKGFDLTVTLGQLRSIQVFMLGEARAPGLYTVSSLSTLVNALFASGGPSAQGTLRDIQLKRGGEVITHFDVYRLLLGGDKSADVHLLPGDIIFVPRVGSQVAIDGNVATPGIFELKGVETIADALHYAGNLTVVASTSRAVVEHIVGHARRSIEELPLDAEAMKLPLKNGDILHVFPISPKIEDTVTLRGTVALPGRYSWKPGMRVSDLIPNRKFLLTRTYFNRQNALDVPSSANPFGVSGPNEPGTSTGDRQNAATENKQGTTTSGNQDVTTTDRTPYIAGHDTEINWSYALIQRLDPHTLTTRLIPFNLGEAVDQPSSEENKALEAGDVVVVYSRKDVSLPVELQAKFVRIDGQVNAPGVYRVEDNETLQDLVRRAGGLAPHAYLYASQLTRESVREEQDAELRSLVERESSEALSPSNLPVISTITGSAGSANGELDLRKAYIAEIAKVHSTGRVVLQVKPDANTNADVPSFLLEDGDHFFVPSVPNTVSVLGNVYNQGALRYLEGKLMKEYLDAAGGATRDGDAKREFIVRADGSIVSRQRVSGLGRLPIYAGDVVVVPPKLKSSSKLYDLLTITQVMSAFGISAAAIEAIR